MLEKEQTPSMNTPERGENLRPVKDQVLELIMEVSLNDTELMWWRVAKDSKQYAEATAKKTAARQNPYYAERLADVRSVLDTLDSQHLLDHVDAARIQAARDVMRHLFEPEKRTLFNALNIAKQQLKSNESRLAMKNAFEAMRSSGKIEDYVRDLLGISIIGG
ncbi:hypothetical protein BH10PAT2_BH10PAT2_0590 [soil metagenome]